MNLKLPVGTRAGWETMIHHVVAAILHTPQNLAPRFLQCYDWYCKEPSYNEDLGTMEITFIRFLVISGGEEEI